MSMKLLANNTKWVSFTLVLLITLSAILPASQAGAVPADTIKLQLLSVNDLHGKINDKYSEVSLNEDLNGDGTVSSSTYVGGMDYMAHWLKQREASNPNTWIIHAGDMVGGSPPISALFQDEPAVEIMEEIGFDVGTAGNHEFDEGTQEMLRLLHGGTHPKGTVDYDGQNFPLTVANVVYKDTGAHVLPPYIINEVEGVKVGFVGVITEETPQIVIPAGIQDIEFTDAADAANEAVAELKAQGVKSIIVLAHIPADQATTGASVVTGDAAALANELDDEVDVVFAGHNHRRVSGLVDGKLVVQAWEYGKAFADVELEIDRTTGDIVAKTAEIVANVQTTADPAVKAIIDNYNRQAAPLLNRVIGKAEVEMSKNYPGMGIGANGDKALGNMIADGMKHEMSADFALMNGGGVRENLNVGDITWGELFSIQPFGNVLVKLEVTGADLEAILNAQLGSGTSFGPDFHVSGFKYTWYRDSSNNRKVLDIILPNGSAMDKTKTYTVVVNNFMHTSTAAKNKPIGDLGKNAVTGPEDLEATVNFVNSFTAPLNYVEEGRIKEVAAPAAVTPTPPTTPTPETPKNPDAPADVTPVSTKEGIELVVDKKDLKKVTTADGKTVTTLEISKDSLSKALEMAAGQDSKKAIIDLSKVEGTTIVGLPASALQDAKDAVIEIKAGDNTYELPLSIMNVDSVAAALGTTAGSVTIRVTIEPVTGNDAQQINKSASQAGVSLLGEAVSFTITAEANGKSTEVNDFGTTYVTRTITIHVEVESGRATAVAFDPEAGEMTFVPATFEVVDGKTVVKIKRNSNSIYTVVKSDKTFADLNGHWSKEDVELLASKLVVKGQTETQFAPNSDITRAEFAALLVRALGLKENIAAAANIKDVNGSEWFFGPLGAAVKAGLMEGFEDGTFRPDAKITREQMAVMISRAMATAGKEMDAAALDGNANFEDGSKIKDWAADAVAINVAAGIIKGTPANTFEPASFASRAEATVMLKRLLEFVEFIN
ncbi:S-layer homology domain-containing protein [Paenibacillus harenae]|uniref:S-layer homology domain-containing protein n=1 Tax=Paenibacillus harenae TaxID=306543 RepID=UPI000684BE24|nr:S-layer homology domain-containing protein [Paenibacillus harenae]